jgi:hypothetical protein
MTSSGLDSATFQLLEQCLNQLCYRVPHHRSTIKDIAGVLQHATNEPGLEMSTEKKYMSISRKHNAGQGHNMRIDNRSCILVHAEDSSAYQYGQKEFHRKI